MIFSGLLFANQKFLMEKIIPVLGENTSFMSDRPTTGEILFRFRIRDFCSPFCFIFYRFAFGRWSMFVYNFYFSFHKRANPRKN